MNPRTTAVLAAVAAVLGLFVYLNEFEGERKRQAAADEAAKIHPGLAAGDVDAVELETLDGIEARFERRDGRWRLVAPFEARAESSALDAIVSALVDLPREGTVGGDKPVAGFGLGDDAQTVRFEAGGRAGSACASVARRRSEAIATWRGWPTTRSPTSRATA